MKIEINIDALFFRRQARHLAVFALIAGIVYPVYVLAGQAVVPSTFSSGQVIRAADVNANFASLKDAINDNDTRIGSLSGLNTSAKSNLVQAINEAAQGGSQGPVGPQGPAGATGAGPVGSVVAYLKSFPGVPALPAEFAECNGQTLVDPLSALNGQTLPDLNGGNRFLRGSSTSGTVLGADTHTHTFTSGTADMTTVLGGGANPGGPFVIGPAAAGTSMLAVKGTNSTVSSLPACYEVVWVMRVR